MRSALDFADRLLLATVAFGAGYAFGLLAAPAAGDVTRRHLAERAREAADAAQAAAQDAAAPLADRARGAARELSERHLPLAEDLTLIDRESILSDVPRSR